MKPTIPRSVLIVDDDDQISQLICSTVRMCGRIPLHVTTFGAALVEVSRGHRELVLLDLTLPDSLADKTLSNIRYLLDRGAGKVIVVTGCDVTEQLQEAAVAGGASAVMSKAGAAMFDEIRRILGGA